MDVTCCLSDDSLSVASDDVELQASLDETKADWLLDGFVVQYFPLQLLARSDQFSSSSCADTTTFQLVNRHFGSLPS
jgi:hypothetical protein